MDWQGWATFGFGATVALTAVLVAGPAHRIDRLEFGQHIVFETDVGEALGAGQQRRGEAGVPGIGRHVPFAPRRQGWRGLVGWFVVYLCQNVKHIYLISK